MLQQAFSRRGLALSLSCAALLCGAVARALPAQPPIPPPPPGEATKIDTVADLDETAAKLPIVPKVKECCGYPIAADQDFRLSFYWLAYETEYANEKYDTDIYDRNGFWLGRYPSAFVYELKLEGTGFLRDGRVLNYDGECTYGIGTCFAELSPDEHPLGRGVQARKLVPFRSVAVDPRYIPIGSTIWVPEIVGMVLPDGTRHDGCLRADDMGGAIKQHKLDFFVESYFNFKFLADQLWWHLKATPHLDEPRCEYLRLRAPKEYENERTDWALIHSKKYQRAQALKARAANQRRPTWASLQRGKGKHGKPKVDATALAKRVPRPAHHAPHGSQAQ